MTDEEIKKRFAETVFVVECTSDERQMLWERFCIESMYKTPLNTLEWKQMNPGFLHQVGELAGFPVCVSVFWAKINGYTICFYEATSRVVDHEMVENWMKKQCHPKWDRGTRSAYTNSANFHHVYHYVTDERKR